MIISRLPVRREKDYAVRLRVQRRKLVKVSAHRPTKVFRMVLVTAPQVPGPTPRAPGATIIRTASSARKRKRCKRASSAEYRLYQSFDLLSQQLVSHINNVMSTSCDYIMFKISSKTPDVIPSMEPPPALVDGDLRPPQAATPLESIADLNVVI